MDYFQKKTLEQNYYFQLGAKNSVGRQKILASTKQEETRVIKIILTIH